MGQFKRRAEEVLKNSMIKSNKRRHLNVQRVKLGKKHVSKSEQKTETGFGNELTTAALELWTVPDFLRHYLKHLGAGIPNFKPEGSAKVQLAHMTRFVTVLRERNVAPRSIFRLLRKIAQSSATLQARLKLKKPIGTWVLYSLTDDVIHEFEHLVYTPESAEYLLTEDIEVEELPTEESADGWLITLPDGTTMRLLREDSDRVLNPRLRAKLGLEQHKPKQSKFDDSELPDLGF